jgi:thioredoxin-like negative regulator of GroEL
MRNKFIPFLITLFLTAGSLRAAPREAEWITSLPEALKASKESGNPVFVEFWATWCDYCKDLEIEFETNEFKRVLSQFVKVRVNFDVETELVKRYQIRTLPTTLVLDERGNVIMKSVGRTKRTVLLRRLTSAHSGYPLYIAERDDAEDPHILKLRGDYLLASGHPGGAITILKDLLNRLTSADRLLAEEVRFSLAFGYFGIRAFSSAAEIFEELKDEAHSSKLRDDAKEALKMTEFLMEIQGGSTGDTQRDH